MTYSGSPWSAAETSDVHFARFMQGWNDWLAKHPDSVIHENAGGAPMCGKIFDPDRLGGPAMKRVILRMLHPDPDKRATIHEILSTSLIKGVECCTPESFEDEDYAVDASTGKCSVFGKHVSKTIQRKHNHIPPKAHKTPAAFQHRFDMGRGYN
jgi:protein-serine/threonine kinase